MNRRKGYTGRFLLGYVRFFGGEVGGQGSGGKVDCDIII